MLLTVGINNKSLYLLGFCWQFRFFLASSWFLFYFSLNFGFIIHIPYDWLFWYWPHFGQNDPQTRFASSHLFSCLSVPCQGDGIEHVIPHSLFKIISTRGWWYPMTLTKSRVHHPIFLYHNNIVTAQPQPQPSSTSTRVGVDKVISWTTHPTQ